MCKLSSARHSSVDCEQYTDLRSIHTAPRHVPTASAAGPAHYGREHIYYSDKTAPEAGPAGSHHAIQPQRQAERGESTGRGAERRQERKRMELEPGRKTGIAAAEEGRDDPAGEEEDGGQARGAEGTELGSKGTTIPSRERRHGASGGGGERSRGSSFGRRREAEYP